MNYLVKILARSRLLKGDVDLHLVRGSMVLIFLLFGYQKWFEYEAQELVPFISNGPLTFWMYPVFGLRGGQLLPGGVGVADRGAPDLGVLESQGGHPRGPPLRRNVRHDGQHHPVHAGRLGRGGRLPGDARPRGVPDEGLRPPRRLLLPAEAGRGQGVAPRGRAARDAGGRRAPRPGRGGGGMMSTPRIPNWLDFVL